jgi:hypothetical protein
MKICLTSGGVKKAEWRLKAIGVKIAWAGMAAKNGLSRKHLPLLRRKWARVAAACQAL